MSGDGITAPEAAKRQYPDHVWADLGQLAPYLLASPGPDEIDDQGCFGRDSISQVESQLLEHVALAFRGFTLPAGLMPGLRLEDRWRLASGLQKAIRACDPGMAMSVANALYDVDRAYLRRRLGVIAVEDVMAGSPLGIATVLAAIGNPQWRDAIGERELLVWLCAQLSDAPGDRSAQELLELVMFDPTADPFIGWQSDADLEATAVQPDAPLRVRIASAWLMTGPQFAPKSFPFVEGRIPTALFRLMVEQGMSRWGLYVAAKACSRVREAMWVSLLFVDEWLRSGDHVEVVPGPEIPRPLISGLLAPTFDSHTREGKIAIRMFFRDCAAMKPFMEAFQPGQRDFARNEGVFLAEGGVLAQRLVYGAESERVYQWVRGPGRGWMPAELAAAYLPTIRENLDELNAYRRRVVF